MYVKFVRIRKIFRTQVFARFLQSFYFVFKVTVTKMRNVLCSRLLFQKNLLIHRLLTSVFVLVNGIVFKRSNDLIT